MNKEKTMNLQGKVALVTGASRGIGAATARLAATVEEIHRKGRKERKEESEKLGEGRTYAA